MMNEEGNKKGDMTDVVVGDEEQAGPPSSAQPPKSGHKITMPKVTVSDLQLPLVLMFATSTILLIAVTTWKFGIKWRAYAISVPAVTMVLSFMGLIMTAKEEFYTKFGKYLNQLLFIWNFVGACFLTFSSPFIATGNGKSPGLFEDVCVERIYLSLRFCPACCLCVNIHFH